MVKVLQDSYIGSPLCKQNLARTDVLIEEAAPRKPPPKVSTPFFAVNLLAIPVQNQAVFCVGLSVLVHCRGQAVFIAYLFPGAGL